ncbi:uncharacterized protein N7515_002942 [Penicillium bovifimosum]|uniref:Uncharacterized protein n=1 Tax=Penicillium bovifimosum TaxID=126998 RepID=A0A9W9HCG4_9EURO|nr:uncharacterized protein N7515_002942 [Penicillium bovifimosum]KAJ5144155.1 hypothetical protein N7515_002942 [Penicillium bovifimosum]
MHPPALAPTCLLRGGASRGIRKTLNDKALYFEQRKLETEGRSQIQTYPVPAVPAYPILALTWNPPIPASEVQNPAKAITRGHPPTASARQAISLTKRSIQRSTQHLPSEFEISEMPQNPGSEQNYGMA